MYYITYQYFYSTPPPHEHASMDTYTIVGGGGGGLPTTPHPLNTSSHNTAARRPPHPSYTKPHTATHNNTQQHYTTALRYIKLSMYQLFLWRLYLMVFRGATSLHGHWKGWAQKSLDFQGPPLPMPLVMMLHPSKPLRTTP